MKLADQWRIEAQRFRSTQEECAIGDDEWFLCKTEADRLERCADELEAALSKPQMQNSSSVACPHCHWGFAPSVIAQHIREKH